MKPQIPRQPMLTQVEASVAEKRSSAGHGGHLEAQTGSDLGNLRPERQLLGARKVAELGSDSALQATR